MKKLLVSLVATALMALGLVGMSSSPAQADCPYSGCVAVQVHFHLKGDGIDKGERATFVVTTNPDFARGEVKVTCKHKAKVRTAEGRINDGRTTVTTDGRFTRAGKWTCHANFFGFGKFLDDRSGDKVYFVE